MNPISTTESRPTLRGEQVMHFRLHHIGFVVRSISEQINGFAESIRAQWDGQMFKDPLQEARVSFLKPEVDGEPLMELVEPLSENSPLIKFLERGGGLHHLCYEVTDLEAALALARQKGGVVVKRPQPAVAFAGRRIAWVATPHRLLIEYLEK